MSVSKYVRLYINRAWNLREKFSSQIKKAPKAIPQSSKLQSIVNS